MARGVELVCVQLESNLCSAGFSDLSFICISLAVPLSGQLLDPPRLTKFVCPTFPLGNNVHIQGVVVVEIVVGKSGEPTHIRALKGHPMLVSATIDAARQWRFRPWRLNG